MTFTPQVIHLTDKTLVRDPEPYLTEDGVRQATSEVPYRFGARTYADYHPRPVHMTSGKHTLDPKPYLSGRGVRYEEGGIYFGDGPLRFAPRCALYDNHNPILDRFREIIDVECVQEDGERGYTPAFAREWLHHMVVELAELTRGTQEQELAQIAHARRVLSKLAALHRDEQQLTEEA